MAAGVDRKVLQYEAFINDVLRRDLQKVLQQREQVYEKISQYLQLRSAIQSLEEAGSLQKEAGSLQKEAGSLQKEAGSLQREAVSVQQEAGSLQKEAGSLQWEAVSVQQEAGSLQQEAGSLQQEAGSLQWEAASVQQDAGSWPLKADVDLGCNFFVQARVDDPSRIFVAVGFGFFVEMSHGEALRFIQKKTSQLTLFSEQLTKDSAKIKAHIRMVLEGLRELQGLEDIPERQRRDTF